MSGKKSGSSLLAIEAEAAKHGIPLRHYRHYQRVQAETGAYVWLFVFEEFSKPKDHASP